MATYNGWTNYATWRVNLEIFDGSEGPWDHHSAKEFAEEIIYSSTSAGIGRDYALAFLSDVNWYEIADHYQDENEEDEDEDEDEDERDYPDGVDDPNYVVTGCE